VSLQAERMIRDQINGNRREIEVHPITLDGTSPRRLVELHPPLFAEDQLP
jgi:hypothetical protein